MSAIKKIFVSSSFHESFEFGFNDERKLLKVKNYKRNKYGL